MNRRKLLSGAAALSIGTRSVFAADVNRWPAEAVDLSVMRVLTDVAGAEGPSMLADGSVVTVEHLLGQIVRVEPSGMKQVLATVGKAPVGTAVARDGMVYIAKLNPAAVQQKMASRRGAMPPPNGAVAGAGPRGDGPPPARAAAAPPEDSPAALLRLDPKTLMAQTVYETYQGVPLIGPNDMVFDRHGDLWLTDFAENCVYCCRIDGSSIQRLISDAPGVNGITSSPDGRTLYVINDRRIVAYSIESRGRLVQQGGAPRFKVIAPWPDGLEPPDGIRMEAGGNLIMGCATSGLVVASPKSGILSQTLLPGYQPINMTFGGPGLRTLFVAAGSVSRAQGKLLALPWPRAGAKPLQAPGSSP